MVNSEDRTLRSRSGLTTKTQRHKEELLFLVLLALVGCAAAATSGMSFGVDWAAFKGNGDSTRVEFFYAIPYDRLEYRALDTGLVAEFSVRFEMRGSNGFKQDAVIFKRARINSFHEARVSRRSFVDGFSVPAPPGRYSYRMVLAQPAQVQSDTTGERTDYAETGSVEDSIDVPDFSDGFALSSVQLAAGVVYDSARGGFSVIPNPMRQYGGAGLDRVYLYFEGYGLDAAADSYEVRVSVLKTSASSSPSASSNDKGQSRTRGGDTVVGAEPIVKPKSGTRVSSTLGVSIAGLAPGEYVLALELDERARTDTDGHGQRESRTGEAVFHVVGDTEASGPTTPYRMEMSETERRYYTQLQYVASPREVGYYNALNDSGKEAYLAWFWTKHNLSEFARRMETAGKRFKTSRTSGVNTDRGRIYVKYGEPDEVEARVLDVDRKPREYWHYYSLGYVFVFIDRGGDNSFKLAYTTSPDEPKTGLEQELTPDEEELFEGNRE